MSITPQKITGIALPSFQSSGSVGVRNQSIDQIVSKVAQQIVADKKQLQDNAAVFSTSAAKVGQEVAVQEKHQQAQQAKLAQIFATIQKAADKLGIKMKMDIGSKGQVVHIINEMTSQEVATVPFYVLMAKVLGRVRSNTAADSSDNTDNGSAKGVLA